MSDSFFSLFKNTAISREDNDERSNNHHSHNRSNSKMPYNGYSEEYLDRLETNGNIQADNKAYSKRK
jgi:hypothetical protein